MRFTEKHADEVQCSRQCSRARTRCGVCPRISRLSGASAKRPALTAAWVVGARWRARHPRQIWLGRRAQDIIRPFLRQNLTAYYLFSPRDAEATRNQEKRNKRESPMTPSQAKRKPTAHGQEREQQVGGALEHGDFLGLDILWYRPQRR